MEMKDYIIPILALVATVVAAYAIYSIGSGLMGEHGANETAADSASGMLLAALEKPGNYSTYTYERVDTMDNYPVTSTFVQGQGFSVVRISSPVFERAIYSNSTSRALCISLFGSKSCSEVAQNSTLNPTFASMLASMPGAKAAGDVKAMETFVRSGAAAFSGNVSESDAGGRACSVIDYTLDYSKLTLSDIEDLGMSPNDPALLYGANYSFEYCIDNSSDVVYSKLDYLFMGARMHTRTEVTKQQWGSADPGEYSFPALSDENSTVMLFLDAIGSERTILACSQNASTRDGCVRSYALENAKPDICLLAGAQKDGCIMILAPQQRRTDLCADVGNASLRDDCWTEMAAKENSGALCANVGDAAKKEYCVGLVANSGEECAADADCTAAGCSGQLCVPQALNGTITTCEYRSDYACLKLTSCGCVKGRCGWDQNRNYTECISESASNQTLLGNGTIS